MKNNFIVVNFFRVTDPYSGGSEVSFNFFKNIPSKKKRLFQLSNLKKKHKNVETIHVGNSKIFKLLNIFKLASKIREYCKNKNNVIIIVEGASWAGYTFLFYKLLRNELKEAKFIYHSQNIEFLLRRVKNNFFIYQITKIFEQYIANNFDIFTCTSRHEKHKIKKIYNIQAFVLSNGIELPKNLYKISPVKKNYDYIFFGGNIDFTPNFDALKILVEDIMPKVSSENPKIKLIVTGNKSLPFKAKYLVNTGFLSKKNFLKYLKGSSLFVNPMQITFGVQTKTLHALALGKTIIATSQGVAGIKLNHKFKNVLIAKNKSDFAKKILNKINSPKFNKKSSNYYSKKFDMKKIVADFFKKKKLN